MISKKRCDYVLRQQNIMSGHLFLFFHVSPWVYKLIFENKNEKPILVTIEGCKMVEQYNIKKNLYLGYITVFLDVIGFSLIVPILPYLSKELGATSTQEGILFSTYCITQMISMMSCNSFIIRFTLYGILQWFLWTKDVPSSFISRIMFGYHI